MSVRLILASASPRRKQLLSDAGLRFDVVPADVDESYLVGEAPAEHVRRLAIAKAAAGDGDAQNGDIVLGADTVVVFDERVYGKPADMAEARRTLAEFAGRTHNVLTGVCICVKGKRTQRAWVASTRVTFLPFDSETIETYLHLVDPLDKAGSYGIQEHGNLLVAGVDGLVSNVIGLPVEDVMAELAELLPGEAPCSS